MSAVENAKDSLYRADSWSWMQDQFNTFDEHDKVDKKPFPTEKPYLHMMHCAWQANRFSLTEKSRQMMMSWLYTGEYLHLCQYTGHRRVALASMSEDESIALLERMWFIYQNQEDWVRQRHPARQVGEAIEWANGSVAIALPKGKSKSRSFVFSGFFFDEMAFNEHCEALFMSSIPGLMGNAERGGRFTGVSSANPGPFQTIVGSVKASAKRHVQLMPGLETWIGGEVAGVDASQTMAVFRLHYSCDPDPYLQSKVAQARATYHQMAKMPWFRREYEIEYESLSGEYIWSQLSEDIHGIEPFPIPDEWARVRVIDPGYRNACAVNWVAVSPPGWRGCRVVVGREGEPDYKVTLLPVLVIYRELHLHGKTVNEIYDAITERSVGEHYRCTLIDPSSDIHKGNEDAGLSTFEQFEKLGIGRLVKADNTVSAGLDEVRQRLIVHDQSPAILIFKGLTHTWKECKEYRYREISAARAEDEDAREDQVRKKNDHHADCVRYVCQWRPMPAKPKRPLIPAGSWLHIARAQRRAERTRGRAGRTWRDVACR